jgi:hypothetical protein
MANAGGEVTMSTFTIEQDKSVREHLRIIAAQFRKRYNGTQWQGDWEDTDGETYGDRLQVPTEYMAKDGTKYLLVLNLLVARNAGGKLSARVSAWRMSPTGVVGSWPVRASATSKKGGRLHNTYLAPTGFVERIGNSRVHFDIVRRLPNVFSDAKKLLDAGLIGGPVQETHGYAPSNPLYGQTYDTLESHLLPFGGISGATKKLTS